MVDENQNTSFQDYELNEKQSDVFQKYEPLERVVGSTNVDLEFKSWTPGKVTGYSLEKRPEISLTPREEYELNLANRERLVAEKIEELGLREQALLKRIEDFELVEKSKGDEINEKYKAAVDVESKIGEYASMMSSMMAGLESARKDFWKSRQSDLVKFSLSLCERILLTEVKADPTLLLGQISAALDYTHDEHVVVVRMSPDDLAALKVSDKPEVKALLDNLKIRWHGDVKLTTGQVFVDAEQYRLDASIFRVLKNIGEDVLEDEGKEESLLTPKG